MKRFKNIRVSAMHSASPTPSRSSQSQEPQELAVETSALEGAFNNISAGGNAEVTPCRFASEAEARRLSIPALADLAVKRCPRGGEDIILERGITHQNLMRVYCRVVSGGVQWGYVMERLKCTVREAHDVIANIVGVPFPVPMCGTESTWAVVPGGMPEPIVAYIAVHLARGLCVLHEQGLVHRDLKLSNAMFDSQFNVKLSDFGLMSPSGPIQRRPEDPLAGAAAYLPPEQQSYQNQSDALVHQTACASADMWAFGLCLAECATGMAMYRSVRHFDGDALNWKDVLIKRIPEIGVLSDALQSLLRGCLATDPKQRWKSRDIETSSFCRDAYARYPKLDILAKEWFTVIRAQGQKHFNIEFSAASIRPIRPNIPSAATQPPPPPPPATVPTVQAVASAIVQDSAPIRVPSWIQPSTTVSFPCTAAGDSPNPKSPTHITPFHELCASCSQPQPSWTTPAGKRAGSWSSLVELALSTNKSQVKTEET